MNYVIVTNNRKVFNFFKETDEVIYLKEYTIPKILEFVNEKCKEGHKLLSDPILYNLTNTLNPFKSILISKEILKNNISSIKMMEEVLEIQKKVEFFSAERFSDEKNEEYRFIDLNLLQDSINKLLFFR